MMTFRTFEIDAGHIASTAGTPEMTADVTAPVRSIRSRRRTSILNRHSSGARLVGFGF